MAIREAVKKTATMSSFKRDYSILTIAVICSLFVLPDLITSAPTGSKEHYLTRNKRHATPHFHAPGLNLGVNYPQVMHFSADDHEGHSVKLNYHRHNMLNHMQKEHHLHRDHVKHVVDHHLHDHLHHNHFNFKTKHHLPFHTVLHRFHYKHHDTHHKADLHNKLFYTPQMYNAYAFVKDHHHHHQHNHNKHHHHYPTEHHHDSSHGHLKLQPGQMVAAGAQQPDFTMMNAASENPQKQLPMVQQPGNDLQMGMMQTTGMDGENAMGMDPDGMVQPGSNLMMQQPGMLQNTIMSNPAMMSGMMPQQPGMMLQQPGMMAQQPGMMAQQPGMMAQQPGMMAQQPGMMAQQPLMMQPEAAAGTNLEMQPMSMQGMQPGMNMMQQPASYMQNNPYMMQAAFQQPAATGSMNYGLQNQAMTGEQQPAMMMGAASMPTNGQVASMMTGGEQPVVSGQASANDLGQTAGVANTGEATQGMATGTDKKFF